MSESSRTTATAADWHGHPARRGRCGGFVLNNRAALGSLAVFVVMMLIFFVANPRVFTTWTLYSSVLTTLPVALFWSCRWSSSSPPARSTSPSRRRWASRRWVFALRGPGRLRSVPRHRRGDRHRHGCSASGVGALVVYAGLSSLIATLGMNFMLRGLILIITEGKSIALVDAAGQPGPTRSSPARSAGIPVQIFWAIAFVVFSALLYNRHRFGAQVHAVGDNPDSAQQMGIDVKRVRVKTFVFMGLGAALAGVFSTMINFTWWPTSGDGYLLPVLASVFVGGTPTWGGIGTVARRRHRRADRVLHPDRHRRRPACQRLLRPVLQRPDHHPVAARPPLEPGTLSLKARSLAAHRELRKAQLLLLDPT